MISRLRGPAGQSWRRKLQDMSLGHGLALLILFGLPLVLLPLARAQDAGTTWRSIRTWPGGHHVRRLVTHGQMPETLYAVGAAGSLYLSPDRGQRWARAAIPVPSSRLEILRILDLATHPTDPRQAQLVVASPAGRPRPMVYSTTSGGEAWRVESQLGPLRVQAIAYSPSGDALYVVTLGDVYRLPWPPGQSVDARRADSLDRFRIAPLGIDEEIQVLALGEWETGTPPARSMLRYLYLGVKSKGLRVLLDDPNGEATLFSGDHADASSVYVREQATVHAICVHPERVQSVCVGTDKGLYATTDAGRTWLPMAYALRQRSVLALLVDPTDNVIYAGVAGGGVLYSADDGATWEQLGEGLGHHSVSCLAVRHTGPQGKTLYAGTNDGLWQLDLP